VADVPGIKLYLQPEQDLTLDTTISPNQYQFVLRGPNQQDFEKYVPDLVDKMKQIKSITDVTSDLNNEGLTVNIEVNRQLAARYGITPATIDNALYDALGQRIVTTIFNQSTQYRVILVAKRDSCPISSRWDRSICRAQTGSTGQVPLSGHRQYQGRQKRPGRQPSGAVSRRHHLVQPDRGRLAQHGGRRDQPDDQGREAAAVDHRHLPGGGAGVPGFAVERGLPADRGAGRRLYRAGRAV
jgi:hypothetical protein